MFSSDEEETQVAFHKHFNEQLDLYREVVCVFFFFVCVCVCAFTCMRVSIQCHPCY